MNLGQGRIALVSGEAGIGKTALIERFVAEQSKPARVLWSACDALFSDDEVSSQHPLWFSLGDFPAQITTRDEQSGDGNRWLSRLYWAKNLSEYSFWSVDCRATLDNQHSDERAIDLVRSVKGKYFGS